MNKSILDRVSLLAILKSMPELDRPFVERPLPLALAEFCAREDAAESVHGKVDFSEHVKLIEKDAELIRSSPQYAELERLWRAPFYNQDIGWATRVITFQSDVDEDDVLACCGEHRWRRRLRGDRVRTQWEYTAGTLLLPHRHEDATYLPCF
jgi:hypothetical protein